MNEENSTSTGGARPKKKRSFWFLKLLLILIVFTGGIVLGLKLYTMPEPSALLNRYFPNLQSLLNPGAAVTETVEPTPVPTAEPTPAPEADEESEPAAVPKETEEPAAVSAVGGADEPDEVQTAVPEPAETPATEAPRQDGAPIGIDAALNAALNHSGVKEDVLVFGVYPTETNGMSAYQVDFRAGDTEYMYLVDMFSDEIVGWKTVRTNESYQGNVPADVFDGMVPDDLTEKDGLISGEDAERAALNHAGVKKALASELSSELRRDGTGNWYEVSFVAGSYKYTYYIDATNGVVLDYNRTKA